MGTQADASSEAVALPTGGGALKGIGETFSPDLHTGTGNFSFPLALPPGRNGFHPSLALAYSTGGGNGPFGLGWSLDVPSISRKTSRGVPRYRDGDADPAARDTFILSGAEDLVPVPGGPAGAQRYRPRTEGGFARIDHHLAADVWEVQRKDGTLSRFGGAQADGERAVVADPDAPGRVYAWRLTETVDPFGNRIRYEYLRDGGRDGERRWDQLYLRRVLYADYVRGGVTKFLASVDLAYEDRPDPFSDRRPGFEVRTRKRCTVISVSTHLNRDRLNRGYQLVYQDQRPEAGAFLPRNGVSLLSLVRVTGHRGEATESLPPLELGYTRFEPEARRFIALEGKDLPARSLAAGTLEMVDLFGSGLPDFLEIDDAVRYWRNLGGGRFDRPRTMAAAPAGVRLGDPGVQLVDANGDGRTDLLVTQGAVAGFYPLAFGGGWDARSFRPCAVAPSFDLRDPEVRLVDLDGDGVTDAVRAGTRLECFFNDPAEGWTRALPVDRATLGEMRGVSFSDPRVRLADMSGDGLQDVVMVRDGNVSYRPSLGHGRWGPGVLMRNAPRLPRGYDPRRVLLGDVDGDGAADLVYVDDRSVTVWINRCGNGWSDPVTIHGTPRVTDVDAVRLADVLGNGIPGVLWSADAAPGRPHLHFLDLTGGVKPFLLNQVDNHTGAVMRVEYAPSTRFFLADQARPETRWRTHLPFPVHVVARTEMLDLVGGSKLATELVYHHGSWDGAEREFRGFARVDRRDTETFERYNGQGLHGDHPFALVDPVSFSPPVETRTWFHPGPVDDGTGAWSVPSLSDEYWAEPFPAGDATALLPTAAEMGVLLPDLPPRARRDALRTLRGQVLRSEVYALDGSPLRDRPYTVTERVCGLREVDPPAAGDERPRIFFPHLLAERTTQWERGADPMTRFAFTGDHDTFGQPRRKLDVAVPRGRDPRDAGEWAEPYLALLAETGYAVPGDGGRFVADRVAHVTEVELAGVRAGSVAALRTAAFAGVGGLVRSIAGQTLNFYDGAAFEGLPLGRVGDTGALVRTETLALTPEVLHAAYGDALPPWFAGAEAEWSGYPAELASATPPAAGYLRREAEAGSPVIPGWFIATARREYDFQRGSPNARGLVRRERDALGHDTRTHYDRWQLLPRRVVDAAGLVSRVTQDYRVLKPRLVRDPNGSRSAVVYSPLGLVAEVAAMGKKGQEVGDLPSLPGTRFQHDLLAFSQRGQPVSVRGERRVHHATATDVPPAERSATLVVVEYSDGFGRLLQTRAQAAALVFGDGFGGGVLPLDRAHDGDPVAGHASPVTRVVVSGWQRYDNKGRVVERHEPFFSTGWAFAPATDEQLGRKVTQRHDALGRMVLTLAPDGSETRVIHGVPSTPDLAVASISPTPWETWTWDPNDNAGRTHPAASQPWARHRDTPSSTRVDALGRTVAAVVRTRGTEPDAPIQELCTRTGYDLHGKVLSNTDALGRVLERTVYDLAGRALRSESIDAGTVTTVLDAMGRPLETNDARGARALRAWDVLGRPSRVWGRDAADQPTTLRERLEYGDGGDPGHDEGWRNVGRSLNQLGRLTRHYDEAGLLAIDGYDFRGAVAEKTRRALRDEHLLATLAGAAADHWRIAPYRMEWTPPGGVSLAEHAEALLDPRREWTSMWYDALGRVRGMQTPVNAEGVRHDVRPAYDRSGALERVTVDGAPYVHRIVYDSKGQRTLIAYGNGVMTRCAYHPDTFRLARLRSERFTLQDGAQPVFTPAARAGEGRPLQDLEYAYDLDGNPLSITDRTPGCGVLGNPEAAAVHPADPALAALLAAGDALVRRFEYDPLGRLVSATGREDAATPRPRPWNDAPRLGFGSGGHATPGQENAPALTALYTERYDWDPAGNLLSLLHQAGGGGWTRRFGMGGRSHAGWMAEWPAHANGQPWPGAPGNRLTHVGDDDAATPQSHVWDAAGNLLRQNTDRHFGWDGANRLRVYRNQVAAGGSTPEDDAWAEPTVCALYLYDAAGQRVKKLVRTQGGAVETTVYVDAVFERRRWSRPDGTSGEGTVLQVMDGRRRIALLHAGPRHPDDQGPALQYHLGDHLESSTLVVDGNGGWVNREELTPFGETTFGSFARKRYRFTGKERDAESGLSYHGGRYYAPWLARWASCDPAGTADGLNLYAYVRGNPLLHVDPGGCAAEAAVPLAAPAARAGLTALERASLQWGVEARLLSGGAAAAEGSGAAAGVGAFLAPAAAVAAAVASLGTAAYVWHHVYELSEENDRHAAVSARLADHVRQRVELSWRNGEITDDEYFGFRNTGTLNLDLTRRSTWRQGAGGRQVPPRGTPEFLRFAQAAFQNRFSDTPELRVLWDRASAGLTGTGAGYAQARERFWTLVNSDSSPEAQVVRDIIAEAGYTLQGGSNAPILSQSGWDPRGTRELADRRLSIDHADPQSSGSGRNIDASNLRFMTTRDNSTRGNRFDTNDRPRP